jgi:hypothetical protein
VYSVKGAPWFLDFGSGRYIATKDSIVKDSPFSERFEKLKEEGIKLDPVGKHRIQILAPWHNKVRYQENQEQRKQLRNFHETAANVAWELSPEELGDEFSFKEYDTAESAA